VKQAIVLMQTMLESVPGTNQYWATGAKFPAQGNNGRLWWGWNARLARIHRIRFRHANYLFQTRASTLCMFCSVLLLNIVIKRTQKSKMITLSIWKPFFNHWF